jgi:hypothetical protein
MSFDPSCLATAIGSFPHTDPKAACDLILRNLPEIPTWPQLPGIDFRESMEIQYSEGLPCVVLDEASERMYFDTSGDTSDALARFYENYLAENLEYFKISPAFGRGIYEMEARFKDRGQPPPRYFKSHVTGPVTLGLGRVDENKRAIYYNDVFRDVIVKGSTMKARWLIGRFKSLGAPQICFIDEPILSAFGSSTYVSVERPEVVSCLGEVVEAIHGDDALAGTHCCGNTEWTILMDAGVDIISFDAYQFGETIGYYPDRLNDFLRRGGVLAWGIIPSSDAIARETAHSLLNKLKALVRNLAAKGIDEALIWRKCLLTPSCGTGTLPLEVSEKVLGCLSDVSRLVRQEAGNAT